MNLKYIKLNKPHLRQHSNTYLLLGSVFFFVFACCLAWIAFWFLQTGWQTHLLNQRFEREGIKVEGYVSGFRYKESTGRGKYASKAGDYPIVTFDTPTGPIHLYGYGGPQSPANQDKLLRQKVNVVYLREEPTLGRVVKWHTSYPWIDAVIGVFLLASSLFCFYFIPRFLALRTE
jgi:hypothetical protein